MNKKLALALLAIGFSLGAMQAQAACSDFNYANLTKAAKNVLAAGNTGGFGLNMWVTVVNETGRVCAVTTTGTTGSLASRDEWLGSRVISAQKANTANAFSLDIVSISTGALYAAVQPGGSLFGLQESNPVNAAVAYNGPSDQYGTVTDPLVGQRIGGVNVFGGGLALYKNGHKVGAIGVSGDTSCTDHAFAWKVRNALGLGAGSPGGFELLNLITSAPTPSDPTFTDLGDHPDCFNTAGIINNAAFGYK
jgi:uncharacterized protein GlcG (DUF336 family)